MFSSLLCRTVQRHSSQPSVMFDVGSWRYSLQNKGGFDRSRAVWRCGPYLLPCKMLRGSLFTPDGDLQQSCGGRASCRRHNRHRCARRRPARRTLPPRPQKHPRATKGIRPRPDRSVLHTERDIHRDQRYGTRILASGLMVIQFRMVFLCPHASFPTGVGTDRNRVPCASCAVRDSHPHGTNSPILTGLFHRSEVGEPSRRKGSS